MAIALQGWKSHLMGGGADKCLKNSRRKPSSAGKTGRAAAGKGRGIPRAVPGGVGDKSRTSNRTKPK